jgi:hypothetical protein
LSHPRCEPGFLDTLISPEGYCTNSGDRSKFLQELDAGTTPEAVGSSVMR